VRRVIPTGVLHTVAATLALVAIAPSSGVVPPSHGIVARAPELLGAGTISTPENDLNSAFTPDGRTIYFTRAAGANGRFGVIVVSRMLRSGRWSTPEVADFSGQYADYDPFVTPDGSRLLFISKRPTTGGEPKSDFDIWAVDRAGNGWGTPRNLGPRVNSDGDELYPSVASDGTLYFSSCGRSDSRGRCDIYRARFREGQYLEPENLGDSVNTPASETDAYVAPDQSYLIVTVYGRDDAAGDGDLYVNEFRGGAWSKARHLGPEINTVAREYCPIVSADGRYLYFTSQVGFADAPRLRRLSYPELRDSLGSVRNGFGNVYRIPVAAVSAWPIRKAPR
jgi:Tol biopolymer transport system component